MKKHMNLKKITAFLLAAAMILTGIQLAPQDVQAASVKRKLSKSSVTLNVGKSTSLSLMRETKYKGKDKKYHTKWVADKTKAKWSSSNSKAVRVSSSGKVKAVKAGTATISAKVSGKTYKCKVKAVAPTVRRLSKSSVTVATGKTTTLTLQKKSGSKWVTDKTKAKWSSSSKSVATVSSAGKVTALKPGKVTISAKISGKTYKCIVTVSPVRKLNSTSLKLKAGSTYTLKLLTANYTVTNGKLSGKWVDDKTSATWSVNGKGNISVNSKGVITIKAGDGAVVYAKKDGKTYSCKVSVINPEPEKKPEDNKKPESKPEDNKKPESGNTSSGNGDSQSGNTSGNGESNSGNGGSTSGNGGSTSGNESSSSGNESGGNAGNTEPEEDEEFNEWVRNHVLKSLDGKKEFEFSCMKNPFDSNNGSYLRRHTIDGVDYATEIHAGDTMNIRVDVASSFSQMSPSELRQYGIEVLLDGKPMADTIKITAGTHTVTFVGKTEDAKRVLATVLEFPEKSMTFCYTDKKIIETRDTTGCEPETKAFWEKIFSVLNEIIKDGMTDEQKVAAISQWLVSNCRRDVNYAGPNNTIAPGHEISFSARGPLLYGMGVCDGYAGAFAYMTYVAGIKTRVVGGTVSYPNGSGGTHGWNQVLVGGKWYYIDVTWMDLDAYRYTENDELVRDDDAFQEKYYLTETLWDDHHINEIADFEFK